MNDPFWDELNAALPRAKRGEPGWANLRGRTLSALKGGRSSGRAWRAGALAAGLACAAALLVLHRRPPAPPAPVTQAMPGEDLEFLETTPLLENLDELLDAPELDHA